ncbi:MAG: rod shape-determining protein MreD [Chloroflexota bacterium]
MILLLAAVGSLAAALIELSLTPHLGVEGAHPHPVLVFGVIWTIVIGVESGLAWAFVGGIALDILAERPLGSTAFALLIAVGGASALARSMVRLRPLAPIVAVPIFSFVYSIVQFVLIGALGSPIPVGDPVAILGPGIAYDAAIAVVIGPLAIAVKDRYTPEERVDW